MASRGIVLNLLIMTVARARSRDADMEVTRFESIRDFSAGCTEIT
jgi:hypothetical protein